MNQSQGILRAGELLNNTYVIEELVGSGGTGEVYRAKNIVSGREFAIKILKQEFSRDEAFINLMRREADVLHNVIDDAVVRYNELLRSEMHGGFVFLVMEFIRGPQLAQIVQARGPVDPAALIQIARRMGKGLMAAHAQNAFHRDMSPDNIILPDGDPTKAKLIDFGIARDISENAQTVVGGGFAGKYQFAAPEQLDGNVDARSDLYSLGMTLLNAYRGKPLNVGTSLLEIVKTKAARVDTRDVPGQLGALIARLVEPNPNDRFQSAAEMLAWLDNEQKGAPAETEATVVMPRAAPSGPSFKDHATLPPEPGQGGGAGKWFVILLLLAGLGGGGWYFGLGPGRDMVFGPKYAVASPYRIEVAAAGGPAPIRVSGNVPTPKAGEALDAALAIQFDPAQVQSIYEYASGEPVETWADDVANLALTAIDLRQWRVVVENRTVHLAGQADDQNNADQVIMAAARQAAKLGYTLTHEIAVPSVEVPNIQAPDSRLDLAQLNTEIQQYATCGPLRVSGGDGVSLGTDEGITISGTLARLDDVDVLDLVLEEFLGGRGVTYNVLILNQPVCTISDMLPVGREKGMEIDLTYGFKAGAAPGGLYRPGENPVIDVVMPAEAEGFLYVFFVDSEHKVIHLLPHNGRQANNVPSIGEVENSKRRVRVAFVDDDRASASRLAFRVTPPFGTNLIIAVLTPEPLFDSVRPRVESFEAFLDDFSPRQELLVNPKTRIVSRYLVTEP